MGESSGWEQRVGLAATPDVAVQAALAAEAAEVATQRPAADDPSGAAVEAEADEDMRRMLEEAAREKTAAVEAEASAVVADDEVIGELVDFLDGIDDDGGGGQSAEAEADDGSMTAELAALLDDSSSEEEDDSLRPMR